MNQSPCGSADTSNPWYPQLQPSWTLRAIKEIAAQQPGSFVDGDWIESPYITNEGVRLLQTGNIGTGSFREQGFRYISDESFRLLKCTEVRPGDVLICRLADPVARACLAPSLGTRMVTSVDVAILKPSDAYDKHFIIYALSSTPYLHWAQALCRGGTRDRISRSQLGTLRIPVPPLSLQRAIADFLDRKTAAIDALIAKKERLLELLAEKRAALIHRAVTKGLDPSVPMKDSGVPWIGEIPAHWEVKPLKHLLAQTADSIRVGPFGSSLRSQDMNGDHTKVYNQRTVIGGDFDSGDFFVSAEKAKELASFRTRAGDILLTTRGTIGRVVVVPENVPSGIIHPCLMALRVDTSITIRTWTATLLGLESVALPQLMWMSNATTIEVIYSYNLREVVLPVPPLDEQDRILARVQAASEHNSMLVLSVTRQLDRLKEYRQALITAAVTGQIDVTAHTEDAAEVPARPRRRSARADVLVEDGVS